MIHIKIMGQKDFKKNMIKLISRLRQVIYLTEHEEKKANWAKIDGNRILRLNYPSLSDKSIVFDLGGYKGDWTSDIYSKYNCNVYIFEPVKEFYEGICNRFKSNKKIKVYNYGLSEADKQEKIYVDEDSSSQYTKGCNASSERTIKVKQFKRFIDKKKINHIDLIKLNIEGSEYDLMDHIIEENLVKKIDNIQIQFHNFIPDAKKRMEKIKKELKKTHMLTYEYEFVWENWTIKNHKK